MLTTRHWPQPESVEVSPGAQDLSVAQLTVAQAPTAAFPPSTTYEVKAADALSKIAKAVYGDAGDYERIFEANQPMLRDPNKIYPGQQLRIPPKG